MLVGSAILVLLAGDGIRAQTALGTGFTYQGRLTDGGAPASGSYDLQFTLFDAATGGTQVGPTVTASSQTVTSGLFTASLDFGASAFTGSARWLEIGVRPGGTSGAFTILTPRQSITPAPNALFATTAASATTATNATQLGAQTGTYYLDRANHSGTLALTQGGTGATSASAARTNLSAAASGANGDITSLTGLTTALSLAQGGTGATSASAARGNLGAAASGANGDITSLSGLTSQIQVTQGGTGANSASGARTSLGAAASGANSDITSLTGLTTALSVAQGGTGSATASAALTALGGQARVTGTCLTGSSVQAVNSDGTVSCGTEAPKSGVLLATLETDGDVGEYSSITIGVDGLGLISYYDSTSDDLKVAHCDNAACSSASRFSLDTDGDVGKYTSITIGTEDGLGLISYYDDTNDNLKVAHCNNVACSSATVFALDSGDDVGQYTSITIGDDKRGLISYYDVTNGNLKVAHCANAECSSASPTPAILDSTDDVGLYTSITIGTDGRGLISYSDATNDDLKVAHCANLACSSAAAVTKLDDGIGLRVENTSITIAADGLGLISYSLDDDDGLFGSARLKVAHCGNTPCTFASFATLENGPSPNNAGQYNSITIGADGLGLISYVKSGWLFIAHCVDATCSSATRVRLESVDAVGRRDTSITIGADGLALISYRDNTNADLKVAHCANAPCSPYVARRR